MLKDFLESNDSNSKYDTIIQIYQYVLSLPCSSVKCETDFSTLKNTKTAVRSMLGDTNLENLMIIKSAADQVPESSIPEIINIVAKSSRKLKTKLTIE